MRIGTFTTYLLAIASLPVVLAAQGRGDRGEDSRGAFDATRAAHGTVRDEGGAPIGGATVVFRVEPGSVDGMEWRNSILRMQPLPRVRSSKDGEFFVPLTRLHRLFTRTTAGRINLVVEKDGYLPWIEPLSAGLRGYLGSRVVLRRITERDRFVVVVENPKPGMKVRVSRFGGSLISGIEDERWFDVPATGEVQAVMSFVPWPLALGAQANFTVPIGIEVQLVFPGRTTSTTPIGYGQKRVVIGGEVPAARFVGVLKRVDGRRLENPRGLYRCPDGVSRWFPVDPDNVIETSYLPLLALFAKGCLAADLRYIDPSVETIALRTAADVADRVIELRDDSGALVGGARAYFFDLERLPAHPQGPSLGLARARRRMMADGGRLDLGGRVLPGPGFLWIHVPGYPPHLEFEPRAITGTKRISLGAARKYGKLQIQVVDDHGKGLAGVYAMLTGASAKYGALLAGLPQTDERGTVTIEHLESGNHAVRLTAAGRTELATMVRVRGTAMVQLKSTLRRSRTYRILIVDDDDKPLPFRTVRTYATVVNPALQRIRTQLRTNSTLTSDSRGRILYSDLPEGAMLRVTDSLTVLVRQAMGILDEEEVNRVTLSGLDTVLMPIPDAPVVRESLIAMSRTSNRSLVMRDGCRTLLARFPQAQQGGALSIYLRGAPPIRVTTEMVTAARKTQGPGVLIIDQRKVSRHVDFALIGLGDADGRDVRVELPGMNFVRNQPYLYGNSGLRVRSTNQGLWSIGLRDQGAYEARLMHPEFLLETVEIPAGHDRSSGPLRVDLRRGTPVVFRLKSSVPLQPTFQFNLYVHTSTNQMVLYQRERLRESNLRKTDAAKWELRLPFALEPGRYYFSLRIYNTKINLPRQFFTVPKGSPLVVEVNDRVGRVSSSTRTTASTVRLLTEKIARLEQSAGALRKMGNTDKKSRERLTKILHGIEAQLVEHKKTLLELQARQRAINAKKKLLDERTKQRLREPFEKRKSTSAKRDMPR